MLPRDVPRTLGRYERQHFLGGGTFCQVWTGRDEHAGPNDPDVVLKLVDLPRIGLSLERAERTLNREIAILSRLPSHPNVVRFCDCGKDSNWLFLVVEFVPRGDLIRTILDRPKRALKDQEAVVVLDQLVAGLSFLHSHRVIHRDMKPENGDYHLNLVIPRNEEPPKKISSHVN